MEVKNNRQEIFFTTIFHLLGSSAIRLGTNFVLLIHSLMTKSSHNELYQIFGEAHTFLAHSSKWIPI